MNWFYFAPAVVVVLLLIIVFFFSEREIVVTITERKVIGDRLFSYLAHFEASGKAQEAEIRDMSSVFVDPGTRILCRYFGANYRVLYSLPFPKAMRGYGRLLSVKEDGSWDAVVSGPGGISVVVKLSGSGYCLSEKEKGDWVHVWFEDGEYVALSDFAYEMKFAPSVETLISWDYGNPFDPANLD